MRNRVAILSIALLLSPAAAAAAPGKGGVAGVSPGLPDRFAPIADRCPTFAWTSAGAAKELELLVYRLPATSEQDGPRLEAPVIHVRLPGAATAWTPSLEDCLEPGRHYSWLLRHHGARGGAARISEPRLFTVPANPSAADVRAALRLLSDHLAAADLSGPAARLEPGFAAGLAEVDPPSDQGRATTPAALEALSAALTVEQEASSGAAHGIVGITNSGDGAGVAADNSADGTDLLLGAAVASESAAVTESLFERESADDLAFDFRNSGAGSMTLQVDSTDVLTTATGAAAAHTHAGEDVTSGTVAEPRVHGDLARDAEIVPTILAGDGPGSGLDADLLDGNEATAFAPAAGSASYVAKTGDTMTGTLTLSPAAGDALVTTAGEVGIGTSSPDKPLHVEGIGAIFNMPDVASPISSPFFSIETDVFSSGTGILSVLDRRQQTVASKTPILLVQNSHASTDATNPLLEARAAGTTRMLLQQDGDFGLQTASPSHPFHLKKFLNGAHLIAAIENTGPFSAAALKLKTPAAGNDWNLVAQETGAGVARGFEVQHTTLGNVLAISATNGNVGVGTLSPADKLHVAGDARVGTGTTGCVKDADGTVIAGTCSSDARLKKNVVALERMLDKVSRLKPVRFNWRSEEFPERGLGDEVQLGLIAQEVERVLPELVVEDEDGFKRVRYSELPLLLLQALSEQLERTERLERQLEELTARWAERSKAGPAA